MVQDFLLSPACNLLFGYQKQQKFLPEIQANNEQLFTETESIHWFYVFLHCYKDWGHH